MINLYHQCGHNSNWNRESYLNDDCGNGFILSPIHQDRNTIERLDDELKKVSIFDPQYYLPSSQKKKLRTYDFFPETISNGFVTADFTLQALESARRCLSFQVDQGFQKIIIPTRHFPEMIPDYIVKQDIYTVHPFLQIIDEMEIVKDVYMTVSLTKSMIMHDEYRVSILNWITSYPRIDGVYLLVEDDRATKQIQEANFLIEYLKMVKELSDIGLKIIVGHLNTEGLLFSLIENCDITFGAYENTRIFSINKFLVSDNEMRGPRARLYLPGLLNWVQFSQVQQIKKGLPDVWDKIYDDTEYAKSVFAAAAEPHFTSPALYKHFFICFQKQVNALSDLSIEDRYTQLRSYLKNAEENYEAIENWPLDLDRHGQGHHITAWLDAINWFKREYIK